MPTGSRKVTYQPRFFNWCLQLAKCYSKKIPECLLIFTGSDYATDGDPILFALQISSSKFDIVGQVNAWTVVWVLGRRSFNLFHICNLLNCLLNSAMLDSFSRLRRIHNFVAITRIIKAQILHIHPKMAERVVFLCVPSVGT